MEIDWVSAVNTAIVGVGGTVSICLAATWLFKSSIAEWLKRETEVFKTELRTNSEKEVETLRSSLQIIAAEHHVKFSKLHEKRAEIVETLYAKLTDLLSRSENFAVSSENNPSPQLKEQYAALWNELNDYLSSIQRNRIFLPSAVCELLFEHLKQIRRNVHVAGAYGGKEHHLTPRLAEQSAEMFTKVYDAFNNEIPAAQKLLEAEFRKMLGVE